MITGVESVLAEAQERALARRDACERAEGIPETLKSMLRIERASDLEQWQQRADNTNQQDIRVPDMPESRNVVCVVLFVPAHLRGQVRVGEGIGVPEHQFEEAVQMGWVRAATEQEIRERRTLASHATDPLKRRLAFLGLRSPLLHSSGGASHGGVIHGPALG